MKRSTRFAFGLTLSVLGLGTTTFVSAVWAQNEIDAAKLQPYIESLKQKHDIRPRPRPATPAPAVEKPVAVERVEPSVPETRDPQRLQPYIQGILEKSGPPESAASSIDAQTYIQALKDGRKLKPRFKGEIEAAAGISMATANNFNVSSGSNQANAFEDVYSTEDKFNLAVNVHYERQFIRNRYVGTVGWSNHLGVIYATGRGIFRASKVASDDTTFKFFAVPVSTGLSYRLTQLKWVVPFVEVLGAGIPYTEIRSDTLPNRKGVSGGLDLIGGLAINLDWISSSAAWDRYGSSGIRHTYLVAQYETLRTLTGAVTFDYDGFYAGFMFEF